MTYDTRHHSANAHGKRHSLTACSTEKIPGMFATLVVCLPSRHTGGAVRLQHGHETKTLSTEHNSAFGGSYLAWYADVTHEVSFPSWSRLVGDARSPAQIEPVLTGYRWVLAYNLVKRSDGARPSADAQLSQAEGFARMLSTWGPPRKTPFLVYPLDHQYTRRTPGLIGLKGCDYHRVRFVADICASLGSLNVFIADVEMRVTRDNNPNLFPTTSERYLCSVSTLEGYDLDFTGSRLPAVYDRHMLGHLNYKGRRRDSRTGGEYTGNSHNAIEDIYRDKVGTLFSLSHPFLSFGRRICPLWPCPDPVLSRLCPSAKAFCDRSCFSCGMRPSTSSWWAPISPLINWVRFSVLRGAVSGKTLPAGK